MATPARREPTDEDDRHRQVIGDVWLSALVGWVTGRATADDVTARWTSPSACSSATDPSGS